MSKILSIIIPVYNVEAYLDDCINSIINSRVAELTEIILINDGSTDNSPQKCISLSKTYPYIKYISQDNKGLSEARNTGIKAASGKYLLFLDSDDMLDSSQLKTILNTLDLSDSDVIFGRAKTYDGTHFSQVSQYDYSLYQSGSITPKNFFLDFIKKGVWFAAWLVVIKREFLLRNQLLFKAGIYHEDELWVPTVMIKAKSIEFINQGFYIYRINREGSIVFGTNPKRELDKLTVAEELRKLSIKDETDKRIIEDRGAALVYGVLRRLHKYKESNLYSLITERIIENLNYLKTGKYVSIYILAKAIGIDNTSALLSKLSK